MPGSTQESLRGGRVGGRGAAGGGGEGERSGGAERQEWSARLASV